MTWQEEVLAAVAEVEEAQRKRTEHHHWDEYEDGYEKAIEDIRTALEEPLSRPGITGADDQ